MPSLVSNGLTLSMPLLSTGLRRIRSARREAPKPEAE